MVMECIWSLEQSINTHNYAKNTILKKIAVLNELEKGMEITFSESESITS